VGCFLESVELSVVLQKDAESLRNQKDSWGFSFPWALVGHAPKTKEGCGTISSEWGCLNHEAHNVVGPDGRNHAGEDFIKRVNHSCGRPSCCKCYKVWANKSAGQIDQILAEASKKNGLKVEHLSISISKEAYKAIYDSLRDKSLIARVIYKKITDALASVGVIGGIPIYHPFRYSKRKGWYFLLHMHFLGFIKDGYDRCRNCKSKKCVGYGNFVKCSGFNARVRRMYESNDMIIKVAEDEEGVAGERRSVFKTARYILGHAGYDVTKKHFRIWSRWGSCSARKLKVTFVKYKAKCPLCDCDIVKIRFNGNPFVIDEGIASGRLSFFSKHFDENGRRRWIEVMTATYRRGSGSYG